MGMNNVIDIKITTVEAESVLSILNHEINEGAADGPTVWFRDRLAIAYGHEIHDED